MPDTRLGRYTLGEEIAHSITHGIGAALSIVGLVLLVVRAAGSGDPWKVVSVAIFGATMFLLYLSSTIYHALYPPKARHVFKILDHSMIYLLIAGTYTPFLLIWLRGGWGWAMFGVIWGLAAAGVTLKAFLAGRYRLLSTLIYLGMGWLCAIAAKPMWENVPHGSLMWLLIGGLSYSLGTIFYLWKGLRYHHAVWHLFVLGGTISHFFAVYGYLT